MKGLTMTFSIKNEVATHEKDLVWEAHLTRPRLVPYHGLL
jgi:hypothetical protein